MDGKLTEGILILRVQIQRHFTFILHTHKLSEVIDAMESKKFYINGYITKWKKTY